jgi:hypothetical protein
LPSLRKPLTRCGWEPWDRGGLSRKIGSGYGWRAWNQCDNLPLRQTRAEAMQGYSEGPSKIEVIQLRKAWGAGNDKALEQLTVVVESELHRLGHRCMAREEPRSHSRNHCPGQRGSPPLARHQRGRLAGPCSFFLHFGSHDTAHPHGFCKVPKLSQARRGCGAGLFGCRACRCSRKGRG